jgi:hypothetical protein
MSYSVAANTKLYGDKKGNFLDDLTNPSIGQWPRIQGIKKITRIAIYSGNIIDCMRVTYLLENGSTPTILHGGSGGNQTLAFDIGANEKLIAVYGAQLVNATPYGAHSTVRLSFVVGNSSGDVPTTKVYTAAASFAKDPTEKFDFTWAVAGASSYTLKPQGDTQAFLQAVGFSKVLDLPAV